MLAITRLDSCRRPGSFLRLNEKAKNPSSKVLALIVAIFGLLYAGVATPSEAAAVGVVLVFILIALVYRQLKGCQFLRVLLETTNQSTMILLITACSAVIATVLSFLSVPQDLAVTETGAQPVVGHGGEQHRAPDHGADHASGGAEPLCSEGDRPRGADHGDLRDTDRHRQALTGTDRPVGSAHAELAVTSQSAAHA